MSFFDRLNLGFGKRAPMILQTEAAECGLACMAMIAGYHGKQYDLVTLRARLGSSLHGITLQEITVLADKIGFAFRPIRLEMNELNRLKTPCILHWDMNHFVVCTKVYADSIVIHDPAVGVRRLSMKEVSQHFTGVALELNPTQEFKSATPPPRVKIAQLFGRFIGFRRTLAYLFGLALVIELLSLVSPFFMSWTVDHAIVGADLTLLNTLALGFGLLLLFQIGIDWLRDWSLMGLRATIDLQASENLLSHLVRLPVSFFEARHLGDILSRFGSQDTILATVTEEFISAILDGMMTIITLVVMFLIAPELAVLAILGAVAYSVLRWISYAPLRDAEMEAIVWGAKAETHLLETLRGIRAIKTHNAQSIRRVQWMNFNVETTNRGLTSSKIGIVLGVVNGLIQGLLSILIIWLGARSIIAGELSVGLLLAFMAYLGVFLGRISGLIDTSVQFWMLRLHAERLSDIALAPPEPGDDSPARMQRVAGKPLGLTLHSVTHRYSPTSPQVLHGIDMKIEPGEWVAITGPSGGGKTTLLKILCGLLQADGGKVLIDDAPIQMLGLENYRNQIGVVLQDDQLFSGSIADNISFFAEKLDREHMENCARIASIYDDISDMPMGFNTLVGDMGTVLSGGQKQRVLLARALYRRPGLLLLDEATSHLDTDNERRINEGMAQLDITRVVVAHRRDTIAAADRIITLADGEIVEDEGQTGIAV